MASTGILRRTGALDKYKQKLTTPAIGTEFPDADLREILEAPNSDELIRDLAITIAERGVVCFRAQKRLGHDGHKEIINRLGALSGRPKESTLMQAALWPVYGDDPEVASLVPERLAARYGFADSTSKRQNHANEWHTDMAFEENPPDFSSLRLSPAAETGGDTCWASGYELYDKLSLPFQKMLESLTGTYSQPDYTKACDIPGAYRGPRGHPDNITFKYETTHPLIRTNPITGWKSWYASGLHCDHINGVTPEENTIIMNMMEQLMLRNHDLLVRYRWENDEDICIWDNRCTFHTPTRDHIGKRHGFRVLSAGEKPFLDSQGESREEYMRRNKIGTFADLARLHGADFPPAKSGHKPFPGACDVINKDVVAATTKTNGFGAGHVNGSAAVNGHATETYLNGNRQEIAAH